MNLTHSADKIYQSEVMGETLFRVARALTWNRERRAKWRLLEALETQTKDRYLEHVSEIKAPPLSATLLGVLYGLLLAAVPWKTAMTMLLEGTSPYMETFEYLLAQSSDGERAFYEYVVAHEKAIVNFASRELEGSNNSLAEVIALLEHQLI